MPRQSKKSRQRSVTLKDIAAELGLSVMAVSKALRGHLDIGAETRRRVAQRAAELGYRPNLLPRQMLSGRTRMIGMVVPSLEVVYFARLAHGVTIHLRKQGYQLVLSNSEGSVEEERKHVEMLLAHRAEGILLCPSGPLRTREELSYLMDSGVPFVLTGRGRPAFPANFVGNDNVAIGRTATGHLLDKGCRRVAHIRGPQIPGPTERFEGYRAALLQHGRRFSAAYVAESSEAIESGYDAMKRILGQATRPDGVFCYTDLAAGGAMRAIREAGLRVPADIAVVGVGNLFLSDLLRIPLSTIDQNPVRMGEEAAAAVLELAGRETMQQPLTRFLPFQLIERESSAVAADPASSSGRPPRTGRGGTATDC